MPSPKENIDINQPRFHRYALAPAPALTALLAALPARARQRVLCCNCPREWADRGSQLKTIDQRLDIQVRSDNQNSGRAIAALLAEKANLVADVACLGGIADDPARDTLAC